MNTNSGKSEDYVTKEDFAKAVNQALENHEAADLAEELNLNTAMVERWASGKTTPMRHARSVILARWKKLEL